MRMLNLVLHWSLVSAEAPGAAAAPSAARGDTEAAAQNVA
jgi:hypothetical protein